MKPAFLAALLLTSIACATSNAAPAKAAAKAPDEVRALWVVRDVAHQTRQPSGGSWWLDAHDAGFNTLIVQVRGRGDAYYKARWEPRAEGIVDQPDFLDPLALVPEGGPRRRNIAVHAWLNTALVVEYGPTPAPRTRRTCSTGGPTCSRSRTASPRANSIR